MKKSVLSLCVLAGLGLTSAEVFAHKAGDWLVRGRIININPDSSSSAITSNATAGFAVPDSRVGVKDAWTLDIDITHMISDNFGVELLLDPSTKHDLVGKNAINSFNKIGETTVLPPALIAQYHFSPKSQFQPYVGLGLNYTMFFKSKLTNATLAGALGGVGKLEIDNKVGWVAQAGADYDMGNGWFVNADVKYIGLKTTASFTYGAGLVNKASLDVDINPWVYGIGIGRRF
jgi:outer membrane protein